jgi:hypothetical protein
MITLYKLAIATTVTVLGLTAIGTASTQAATITYDFTVKELQGPLSGNEFTGWFSFDDTHFTRTGLEVFDVLNDNLQIEFSFLGETFNQNDESFEIFGRTPPVPNVSFLDGILQGLSYRVDEVRGSNLTSIPDPVQDFTILNSGFGYRTIDDEIFLGGKVESTLRVPEPSMILALGFLGAGFFLKKKRA